MRLNKIASALALFSTLALSTSVNSAIGLKPWVTNNTLNQNLQEQYGLVSSQIDKQTASYVKNMNTNTENIVEAVRIATAQEAVASTQIAQADRHTKQAFVGAMLADSQAEATASAMIRFSPNMGQGYAACVVLAENTQLAQVVDSVPNQAGQKADESDNAANAMSDSYDDAFKNRTAIHNQNFCTEAEAAQGSCKAVDEAMQGADSNAATLMVSARPGSQLSRAKQTVRQNILGSPVVAIPSNVSSTASGQAYLYAINHKTALSAFPAYSLAHLESMSEIREDIKDADGKPQSPNDMIFNTVARYYGGNDAGDWQASMIAQQPRGLLVELAKMEGLGAWMDNQEYLSMQRMEGNIAAMTLVSALPMEQRLEKQRRRAVKQSIRDNVIQ